MTVFKIHDHEFASVKANWRLFFAFWVLVGTIIGSAYSIGLLDKPAAAGEVKQVRNAVDSNGAALRRMGATISRLETNRAVSDARRVDVERRLQRIEDGQMAVEGKIDRVIDLLLSRDIAR